MESEPMHFNSFDIRRRAHTATRRDTSMSWNPFRHFQWEKQPDSESQKRLPSQSSATPPDLPHGPSKHYSIPEEAAEPLSQPDHALASQSTALGDEFVNLQAGKIPNTETNTPDPHPESNHDPDSKPKVGGGGIYRQVEPKVPFTVANQIQRTILSSWINLLLFAAPIGIALNYIPATQGVPVFVVNFVAIIPLAAMLSFATEEIALRTGETLGGLLNATFGNAVELIIAIIALKQHKVTIVQTSLIGSILSNLLLVLGCCFLFGGLFRREQYFNTTAAQTAASLLILAVAAVIVPTVFDAQPNTGINAVAPISRGAAVILLIVYAGYLFFQLKTHQKVISEEGQKTKKVSWRRSGPDRIGGPGRGHDAAVTGHNAASCGSVATYGHNGDAESAENARMSPGKHDAPPLGDIKDNHSSDDDEADEGPQLHFWVAVATLAGATVIIALCAEFMVDAIDSVTKSISEEFVGLILLPIVGNAAEHATAVTVAIKDKMDLAIGVAVGSSIQVALFLVPLLVIVGWGLHDDEMTLSFDVFQVAVLFVAVLLINYLIGDGKSHWLEGFLLISLYAIIAVCAYWYPNANAVG